MADWEPTGPWKAAFRNALKQAFDQPSFALLISDYFAPESFDGLSPPGFGKIIDSRFQEVIEQARMNGWLLDLVSAAYERRPKQTPLRQIAEDLGLTAMGQRLINPTDKNLEALIQQNAKSINPTLFMQRFPQLEGQICFVEIPSGGGTGFLVGPDVVLTNYHVILPLLNNLVSWQNVVCRFDYRFAIDGTPLDKKKTVAVALHSAAGWLVDKAPPSDKDWDPTFGDAAADECDYALLRLAEDIGNAPIHGGLGDATATARSWIQATATPVPAVAAGNQVFLLQHPAGQPQQLTIGTVKSFNAIGTRVRYDANSKKGSSGSPLFNADLQLVALHHAHDPNDPPAWNQGVPFAAIQKMWTDRGITLP